MNKFSIALFPSKSELNALNYKCTTDESFVPKSTECYRDVNLIIYR